MNLDEENRRLRQRFETLPKTAHGELVLARHPDIRPEWVMSIIEEPYDVWNDIDHDTGEPVVIFAGRVPARNRWIKVIYKGHSPETGRFETAHFDRRLQRKYGGRPWGNQTPIQNQNQ